MKYDLASHERGSPALLGLRVWRAWRLWSALGLPLRRVRWLPRRKRASRLRHPCEPACLHRAGQCASVLAGIKVVRPVGRSTLTPAAARQARRVTKAGRFCASQFLDNQDHDNPIPLERGHGEPTYA